MDRNGRTLFNHGKLRDNNEIIEIRKKWKIWEMDTGGNKMGKCTVMKKMDRNRKGYYLIANEEMKNDIE